MGDILELIKSRRTVKYFLPKFVSWENISKILDAGRHAPSCGNLQNWKFLVVIDPGKRQAVAEATHDQLEIAMAGCLIIVLAEPEKAERYYGLRGERLYTIQNCAAAIQNMLLEAHSLGLGSAWVGAFDEEKIKSMFMIPDEVRPQAIVAIGYAKEEPPKSPKYPLETVVYFGGWRSKLRDPAKYMNEIASILARKAATAQAALSGAVKGVAEKLKPIIPKPMEKEKTTLPKPISEKDETTL